MYPERLAKITRLLVWITSAFLAACGGGGGGGQTATEAVVVEGDFPIAFVKRDNVLLAAESGESMAETRTRIYPGDMNLMPDMVYSDIWTDAAMAGRAPDPDLVLTYDGLPDSVAAPVDGVVNYPDHIQPLWEADRGADTCTGCHADNTPDDPVSAGLDLRGTVSGTGRLTSYEEIMVGDPVIDPVTGSAGIAC
jgi:hypothetical protein